MGQCNLKAKHSMRERRPQTFDLIFSELKFFQILGHWRKNRESVVSKVEILEPRELGEALVRERHECIVPQVDCSDVRHVA